LAIFGCKRVNCDKIDGDRPKLPANKNCYRLYGEKLRVLELTTLEKRRLRGDLIKTYKIIIKKEHINPTQFFHFTETGHDLKGHRLKLSQVLATGQQDMSI